MILVPGSDVGFKTIFSVLLEAFDVLIKFGGLRFESVVDLVILLHLLVVFSLVFDLIVVFIIQSNLVDLLHLLVNTDYVLLKAKPCLLN